MTNLMPWDFARSETNKLIVSHISTYAQLFMPMDRLQEFVQSGPFHLPTLDVIYLIWAIESLATGNPKDALYCFEYKMLPLASARGPEWHACVLLWCALCRFYSCDAAIALTHIETAEKEDLVRLVPEVNLVKGMALRLSGNIPAATEVLRAVSRRSSSLHPSQRDLAIAWLIETQAAAGTETASLPQIRWLERKNRYIYNGGVGIILAALLRLTYVSDSEHRAQERQVILAALDEVPLFQRPLLTMLLVDILPRPLAGVEPGKHSAEYYWTGNDG